MLSSKIATNFFSNSSKITYWNISLKMTRLKTKVFHSLISSITKITLKKWKPCEFDKFGHK